MTTSTTRSNWKGQGFGVEMASHRQSGVRKALGSRQGLHLQAEDGDGDVARCVCVYLTPAIFPFPSLPSQHLSLSLYSPPPTTDQATEAYLDFMTTPTPRTHLQCQDSFPPIIRSRLHLHQAFAIHLRRVDQRVPSRPQEHLGHNPSPSWFIFRLSSPTYDRATLCRAASLS